MKKYSVFLLTIILTIVFWMVILFSIFSIEKGTRNKSLYKIDRAVNSYLDEVTREKVNTGKDNKLPKIIAETLNPLEPEYHFKPFFANDTVCLVVYQNMDEYYGPITITMVYFQDNRTGKRWCLPETYARILSPKTKNK